MTRDRANQGHVVVVFGATGTAGMGVVHACLADPGASVVQAITRRPLSISHAKLHQVHRSDFVNLGGIAQQFEAVDCCVFCLCTSVRNVKDENEYREIHETYALAAARTLLAKSPNASFVYLSGAGAKRTSRMMWARVKAEAEDRLAELKLTRHANVRPAAIIPMHPTGVNRWLLAPLMNLMPALGIKSVDLGRAMLRLGLDVPLLQAGKIEEGTRMFVETVAFGPGAWNTLPQAIKDTFINNALTWPDELRDPGWSVVDLEGLRRFDGPALFTTGTASASFFPPIVERIAAAFARARLVTYQGAGHVPHATHPNGFLEVVLPFLREVST